MAVERAVLLGVGHVSYEAETVLAMRQAGGEAKRTRGHRAAGHSMTRGDRLPAMATFELEADEQVLHRESVSTAENGKVVPGEVILTTQRVVLVAEKFSGARMALGLLGGLLSEATKQVRVTHEIRRESFADAELIGKKDVRVRSKGEGYAMTWFDFSTSTKTCKAWIDRLHTWATGSSPAAPLPAAKLVDH